MLYYSSPGALAQLGAHNTGSVGVTSSSLVCSTIREWHEHLFGVRAIPLWLATLTSNSSYLRRDRRKYSTLALLYSYLPLSVRRDLAGSACRRQARRVSYARYFDLELVLFASRSDANKQISPSNTVALFTLSGESWRVAPTTGILSPSHSRPWRAAQPPAPYSLLWGTPLVKTVHRTFFTSLTSSLVCTTPLVSFFPEVLYIEKKQSELLKYRKVLDKTKWIE